jgi:hypothetical protein
MAKITLSDGKVSAGWLKSFLFEKAICDKRHTSVKKLRHAVITFTTQIHARLEE